MLNQKLCKKTRIHNYSISFKSNSNLSDTQRQQPPLGLTTYKITKDTTLSNSNKNSATKATENLSRLSNTLNYYPKYINTQPNTKISTFICTSPNESSLNEKNNLTQFNIEYLNPFDRCSLTIKTLHINTKRKSSNYTFNDRPSIMKHHRRYIKSYLSKNISLKKKHYKLASGDDLTDKVDKLFNKDKKFQDELNDKVNLFNAEYKSLHKTIKNSLINDINQLRSFSLTNDNFYKQKENKVNFIEDMLVYPHLQNNFQLRKSNNEVKELSVSPNYLSRINQLSLNKERKTKIFIQDYEKKTQKNIALSLHNKDTEEDEIKFYEKYRYEFNEFLRKRDFYKKIEITKDKKARKIIYENDSSNHN